MSRYEFLNEKKKHIHTLNGQPLYGTSTVVGILNKPLTWWAAGQALEPLGWKNSKKHTEEEVLAAAVEGLKKIGEFGKDGEAWAVFLDTCYRAHDSRKKEAADTGTDLHAELENYVKECLSKGGEPQISDTSHHWAVDTFAKWSIANIEKFLWSEGHCYSEKHWLGGISDAGARMKNGNMAILDFKSSKEAYYSQGVQIAGYALQVEENGLLDSKGNAILPAMHIQELIVVPFGTLPIRPVSVENVAGFKEAFIGCLTNYKLNQAWENK